MNNQSIEKVSTERLKQFISQPMDNGLVRSEVMEVVHELLAFREAAEKPVAHIFKHPYGKLFWSIINDSNAGDDGVVPVYAAPQLDNTEVALWEISNPGEGTYFLWEEPKEGDYQKDLVVARYIKHTDFKGNNND